jgi:hypothetical protein
MPAAAQKSGGHGSAAHFLDHVAGYSTRKVIDIQLILFRLSGESEAPLPGMFEAGTLGYVSRS